MKTYLATHDDADGYGCSTQVMARVGEVVVSHVSRYPDVVPILQDIYEVLRAAPEACQLLLTDLGLDPPTLNELSRFPALNADREGKGLPAHRIVAIDHHASTVDALARHVPRRNGSAFETRVDGEGVTWATMPGVTVMVDVSHCATTLCATHAGLYAVREPADPAALAALSAHVEAVDLWLKDDPRFPAALAILDVFEDNRRGLIPDGHADHDRFVSRVLLGAVAAAAGRDPAGIEAEAAAIRIAAVDEVLAGWSDDDRSQTTRMRTSRRIADDGLYHRVETREGTLMVSFGIDSGVFQRTSDVLLTREPGHATYANVFRSGGISFRSNDGSARRVAKHFRGGGHDDAAGGALPNGATHSVGDAKARLVAAIGDPSDTGMGAAMQRALKSK